MRERAQAQRDEEARAGECQTPVSAPRQREVKAGEHAHVDRRRRELAGRESRKVSGMSRTGRVRMPADDIAPKARERGACALSGERRDRYICERYVFFRRAHARRIMPPRAREAQRAARARARRQTRSAMRLFLPSCAQWQQRTRRMPRGARKCLCRQRYTAF